MRKRSSVIYVSLFTMFCLLIAPTAVCEEKNTLTIMWWNVENLFDTLDDPETNDEEFTPTGRKRWTEKKLLLKYMRLSHIIKVVRLKTGTYPDILAFAEVENRKVFNKLLSFLPGSAYKTAYHASDDPRGIDIALAYDSTSLTLRHAVSRSIRLKGKNTRDITLYDFVAGGSPFSLMVNHWPSRALDRAWSEPQRLLAARSARSIVDSLWSTANPADIIVIGDFNDDPHDTSIRSIMNATTDKTAFLKSPGNKLFNCWGLTGEKGSCFFMGKWLKFDQVMVSAGLFDTKGLSITDSAFSCLSIPHMRTGKKHRPYATYRGPKFLGGYSDHFPLLFKARVR